MTGKPALLVTCGSCGGTGELPIAAHKVPCMGCNGHGHILHMMTIEQMEEWLKKRKAGRINSPAVTS